jgi:hypothetical protein
MRLKVLGSTKFYLKNRLKWTGITCSTGIEMTMEFGVTGLFYMIGDIKFRKYLDIKRTSRAKRIPDLMVVMMNPGSSRPIDGNDKNSIPSEAFPDATQKQIMRVMNSASFDFARVINLSDLRTPNSDELYRFISSEQSKSIDHSIFSNRRKADLNKLFVKNIPVIFGWGVDSSLIPLAKLAVESLSISNPLGMLKPDTQYSYYHPLQRTSSKRDEWMNCVTKQSSEVFPQTSRKK